MAAPNIINVTDIRGRTAVLAITNTATAILTNSTDSGKVYKVNALYISNVDGANSAEITVDIYRSTTAYHIAKSITVPGKSTIDIISKSIYLEEGDSLRLSASINGDLEAVCSYEEIV
jgi:hypothetical protein